MRVRHSFFSYLFRASLLESDSCNSASSARLSAPGSNMRMTISLLVRFRILIDINVTAVLGGSNAIKILQAEREPGSSSTRHAYSAVASLRHMPFTLAECVDQ